MYEVRARLVRAVLYLEFSIGGPTTSSPSPTSAFPILDHHQLHTQASSVG